MCVQTPPPIGDRHRIRAIYQIELAGALVNRLTTTIAGKDNDRFKYTTTKKPVARSAR